MAEHIHVSPQSQQRDVSGDRWVLTPLGQALLDGLRALQVQETTDQKGTTR